MELNYHLPSAMLQPLFTVFGDIAAQGCSASEMVPAMLPNLHIRLAGRSVYRFADGKAVESPRVALLGASNAAFELWMSADFEMMFAGILPLGWQSLVPFSAAELTGTIVDASALWPASMVDRLLEQCQSQCHSARRLASLEKFLLARRLEAWPTASPRRPIIDRWIERSTDLSIDALCAELEVSARQLQRLTLHHYGLAPKMLAMKYRSLRAAASLSLHGASVADAAGLFCDQSHLTRDFRRFVGWTPGTFVEERLNLAAATLHGRHLVGASRPLAVLG